MKNILKNNYNHTLKYTTCNFFGRLSYQANLSVYDDIDYIWSEFKRFKT